MSAALSAARMLAEALAYSRMRWRWRTLCRAAAVRVARRRLSRGLRNDAIDAFQPLQPRLEIRGGERPAKGIDDLRQLKGLVGRDRAVADRLGDGRKLRREVGGAAQRQQPELAGRCRRGAAIRLTQSRIAAMLPSSAMLTA